VAWFVKMAKKLSTVAWSIFSVRNPREKMIEKGGKRISLKVLSVIWCEALIGTYGSRRGRFWVFFGEYFIKSKSPRQTSNTQQIASLKPQRQWIIGQGVEKMTLKPASTPEAISNELKKFVSYEGHRMPVRFVFIRHNMLHAVVLRRHRCGESGDLWPIWAMLDKSGSAEDAMATSRRARATPAPCQPTFFVLVPLFRLYKELGLIPTMSASLTRTTALLTSLQTNYLSLYWHGTVGIKECETNSERLWQKSIHRERSPRFSSTSPRKFTDILTKLGRRLWKSEPAARISTDVVPKNGSAQNSKFKKHFISSKWWDFTVQETST
jgi:hypothetical protein